MYSSTLYKSINVYCIRDSIQTTVGLTHNCHPAFPTSSYPFLGRIQYLTGVAWGGGGVGFVGVKGCSFGCQKLLTYLSERCAAGIFLNLSYEYYINNMPSKKRHKRKIEQGPITLKFGASRPRARGARATGSFPHPLGFAPAFLHRLRKLSNKLLPTGVHYWINFRSTGSWTHRFALFIDVKTGSGCR